MLVESVHSVHVARGGLFRDNEPDAVMQSGDVLNRARADRDVTPQDTVNLRHCVCETCEREAFDAMIDELPAVDCRRRGARRLTAPASLLMAFLSLKPSG